MNAMKQIEITTTTHPIALALYAALTISGVTNVLSIRTSPALETGLGLTFLGTWAVVVLISGIMALGGALTAPYRKHSPVQALQVEMIGCIGIALTRLIHEIVLAAEYRFEGLETQGLVISIVVGAVARAIQIRRQIVTIRAAQLQSAKIELSKGESKNSS